MGFYLRKSLSFGPLRINLSKSGVGYSVGARGLRVGSGPRGSYVHMGRHGLYYRASLGTPSRASRSRAPSNQPTPAIADSSALGMVPIESADVLQMHDASSVDVLAQLNASTGGMRWTRLAFALGIGAFLLARTSGSSVAPPVIAVATLIAVIVAHLRDSRPRMELTYDLDPAAASAWDELRAAFDNLQRVALIRNIAAEQRGDVDAKRNAGAGTLVSSTDIRCTVGMLPRVKSNVEVPVLPAGRETLYFFPDRLIVTAAGQYGAVPYDILRAEASTTRVIEGSARPSDAEQVDTTWRFVNKSGGPDRRYRDNPQLPIYEYGVLDLESPSGLRERFHVSRAESAGAVAAAITAYANHHARRGAS
jgi:hypothetical protein